MIKGVKAKSLNGIYLYFLFIFLLWHVVNSIQATPNDENMSVYQLQGDTVSV